MYYIFGVVRSIDHQSQTIPYQDIAAFYEEVSEQDFGEQALAKNLKDMSWVSEKALHHQEVLNDAVNQRTIIPFKFGSVFSSKDKVIQMLRARADQFNELLSQLEGNKEWGLKLYYDEEKLDMTLNQEEDLQSIRREFASSSPGKQFLLKKKEEQIRKELKKTVLNKFRQDFFDLTRKNAVNRVKQLETTNPELDDKQGVNILNLAVLAPNKDFLSNLSSFQAVILEYGLNYHVTGPWPAYNFVSE